MKNLTDSNKDILVALSGGIDSAATIIILKNRGYNVAAVTFDLFGDTQSIEATKQLADKLEVRLIVKNIREKFESTVIKYFLEGYLAGETPAPCSYCNPLIKWDSLAEVADSEGIFNIATGHYVRIVSHNNYYYVAKGVDPRKDQSYYLSGLDQGILKRAHTPLGDFSKDQIRLMMTELGFENMAQKKESMGVCFLGKGGYSEFLLNRMPELKKLAAGEIVNSSGEVVGNHNGYPFYTIGQKRGFSTNSSDEKYIVDVDPSKNRLTVGTIEKLYYSNLIVRDFHAVNETEFFEAKNITVKIRGVGWNPDGFCKIKKNDDKIIVETSEAVYAPAIGQPMVFYIDDRVVGSAILEQAKMQ